MKFDELQYVASVGNVYQQHQQKFYDRIRFNDSSKILFTLITDEGPFLETSNLIVSFKYWAELLLLVDEKLSISIQ
jgi:hypothetical protein